MGVYIWTHKYDEYVAIASTLEEARAFMLAEYSNDASGTAQWLFSREPTRVLSTPCGLANLSAGSSRWLLEDHSRE